MREAVALDQHFYSVTGIHCSSCLRKIMGLSESTPNLDEINVDMSRQLVVVKSHPGFESRDFETSIRSLGFGIKKISSDDSEKTENESYLKTSLINLGIAGALTGNIMLLSYSVYLGAPQEFALIFNWISFGLFLPVVGYCARSIFQNSWRSLQAKKASIDTPLAIALAVGGLMSAFNLVVGEEAVYFDSLSALIFLTLTSRHLVKRVQVRHIKPLSVSDLFDSTSYEKVVGGKVELIQRDEIAPGDVFFVKQGETVPVDCVLESELAEFDNALLTGESEPVVSKKWDEIYAGTKVLSEKAQLKATTGAERSRISQLIARINKALQRDGRIVSVTDKVAQVFTFTVLLIGSSFFFWSGLATSESMNRVLALLVIACPCALAVTSPLALSLGIKKAISLGLLIKSADVFEKVSRARKVIFDKTGTLITNDELSVVWDVSPSPKVVEVIRSLESKSQHPVAKAMLRSLEGVDGEISAVKNFREIPGLGVQGEVHGVQYDLKKASNSEGRTIVELTSNQELVWQASISASVSSSTIQVLKQCKEEGLEVTVLTGDNSENSERFKNLPGIDISEVISNMTPEEKSDYVLRSDSKERFIFVGDGMNDSLAMVNSGVGVSMNQSVDATFRSSDVHFLKNGVADFTQLIALSKRTMATIYFVLLLSLVYNIAFGTLALMGFIGPLLAAILMPISSVTLLAISVFSLGRGES